MLDSSSAFQYLLWPLPVKRTLLLQGVRWKGTFKGGGGMSEEPWKRLRRTGKEVLRMGEMSGETWKEGKGSEGGTLGEGMSEEGG